MNLCSCGDTLLMPCWPAIFLACTAEPSITLSSPCVMMKGCRQEARYIHDHATSWHGRRKAAGYPRKWSGRERRMQVACASEQGCPNRPDNPNFYIAPRP
jgi:hypothetical protein